MIGTKRVTCDLVLEQNGRALNDIHTSALLTTAMHGCAVEVSVDRPEQENEK